MKVIRCLGRGAVGVLNFVDHHWPLAIVVLAGGGMGLGYSLASGLSKAPVLVGRLDVTTRGIFYGSIATSAGALLGLIIASLAILLTLDDSRTRVAEMQAIPAWKILNRTLLTAAGFMAATLALSTVALGVDAGSPPNSGLEIAVVTVAVVAFFELMVGGAAFAIVVGNLITVKQAGDLIT